MLGPRRNVETSGGSASRSPSLTLEPHFLLTPNPEISDYRPVVNADASAVIFERTFASNPNVTTLYSLSLCDPRGHQVR